MYTRVGSNSACLVALCLSHRSLRGSQWCQAEGFIRYVCVVSTQAGRANGGRGQGTRARPACEPAQHPALPQPLVPCISVAGVVGDHKLERHTNAVYGVDTLCRVPLCCCRAPNSVVKRGASTLHSCPKCHSHDRYRKFPQWSVSADVLVPIAAMLSLPPNLDNLYNPTLTSSMAAAASALAACISK